MFSLEKLCLNLIAHEFEQFYCAFKLLKDKSILQNLRFLQTNFSVQLATMLCENKNLEEDYLEFLMNEYLYFLDSKWFTNCPYLCIEDIFHNLPNLKRISYHGCSDEILKNIVKFCPKIIELDVSSSDVTDNGIEYLCKNENGSVPCPELKILFLKRSHVTDKGVKNLILNRPSLERLDHEEVPHILHSLYKDQLSKFEEVCYYNLTELDLRELYQPLSLRISDAFKTCFRVCPKLEAVSCVISDEKELDFITNDHLKKLNVEWLRYDASFFHQKCNMDNFIKKNGRNLTFLKVKHCTISVSLLAIHCPVLEELIADDTDFTHDGDMESKFLFLTKCTFTQMDFILPTNYESMCFLFSISPNLETLSILVTNYRKPLSASNTKMETLILLWCKNPSAKKINFQSIFLKEKFLINILQSCPSLEEMCVNNCGVDINPDVCLDRIRRLAPAWKTSNIEYYNDCNFSGGSLSVKCEKR